MKKYGNKKIQYRVICMALGFSVLAALSVVAASAYTLYKNALRAGAQTAEYRLQVAASSLNQSIDEIDALADWCTVNSTVRNFALYEYRAQNLVSGIYNTVSNKYSSLATARYIQRFLIVSRGDSIIQLGTVTNQSRALTREAILSLPGMAQPGVETAWQETVADPLLNMSAVRSIPITRTLRSDTSTGRVYISVSTALITDCAKSYALDEGASLYWVMGGQVYEVQNGALAALGAQEDIFYSDADANVELLDSDTAFWRMADGSGRTVIARPLGKHGLYIAQSLVPVEVFDGGLAASGSALTAVTAVLLLGILLALMLRRTIAAPIGALQEQLRRISGGDFRADPDIEWDNELGDIGRGINALSHDVSALMERRIEDEKQKKDLEYQMLQNQINPHFLYNTLNSIKWMATIQHAPGIAEMTTALSRLLKSVSKGSERLVPLVEEFALLNDYFTIQQYRYGGTVTMDVVYIEDERLCMRCSIPRFTLQPLVENAIFHGIEPKGCAGRIDIRVLRRGGDVLVELTDDGVGMTEERIQQALTPPAADEREEKFRHVGVWNVHRRLQYSFGENYGLSIRSTPGAGTTVTVRLPLDAPQDTEPQKEDLQ